MTSKSELLRSESASSEKRLSIKEIREALSPKYEELFQDPVFESWILAKQNKHKYGLSLSSFKLYVPIIYDLAHFVGLTPRGIIEKAYPHENRLEWKMKLEHWFNLMVGQIEPKDERGQEVAKHDWNSAKKWLTIANEFFVLNNIELGLNMPATADVKPPFVPSKDMLRKALEIAEEEGDPHLYSYILVAKDSAISEIDLINHDVDETYYDERLQRKYDSVGWQYRKGKLPIYIVGRRKKTGVPYVGFLGEEAYSSLQRLDGDFPFDGHRLIAFQSKGNIQKKFRRMAKELNQPLFVPKCLRAFSVTAILSGDINQLKAKILSGHEIKDIEKFYVNFDIETLSQAYLRVYPSLRVLS